MAMNDEYQDAQTQNGTSEALLSRYDWYIAARARCLLHRNALSVHPAVLDLEIEELTQRSRIKFWNVLGKSKIEAPYAYIRSIVYSEFITMKRQQKTSVPLTLDDSEDSYPSEVRERLSLLEADPAHIVEQQEEEEIYLNMIVQLVLSLPGRQRQAMICLLKERIDDVIKLVQVFQQQDVNIGALQWPQSKREKQVLQASLSAARHTLTRTMKERGLFKYHML